ncbi:MAG: hypothetical protein DRI65_03225, partial [Chloroflexota bacterium]
ISIPLEGLKSYGDFWNFYHLASLGRPFLDLWVEFPPLFPVLSRGIYLMVGGREHSFIYALIAIFSIIQAANIYLFQKIARAINAENESINRVYVYVFFLVGLFYGWAYFDSLAVFCLLLGLYLITIKNARAAGLVIGVGGLIKWFPFLVLPAAWKWLKTKKALTVVIIAVFVISMGWGLLLGISPEFTKASLTAQGAKGSWETVWALIDGNLSTGNFNPDIDRTIASSASISTGNPPVVPVWLSLLILGGIGCWVFWKSTIESAHQIIGMSGFTMIVFFLWSPGYSPQWTLYLLPLVILCFKNNRSLLIALVLTLVNLLEWPILLSRGWFQYLDEIVLTRTAIFILLAFLFAQIILTQDKNDKVIN